MSCLAAELMLLMTNTGEKLVRVVRLGSVYGTTFGATIGDQAITPKTEAMRDGWKTCSDRRMI